MYGMIQMNRVRNMEVKRRVTVNEKCQWKSDSKYLIVVGTWKTYMIKTSGYDGF